MKMMGDYTVRYCWVVVAICATALFAQAPAAAEPKSDEALLSEKFEKVQKVLSDEAQAPKDSKDAKDAKSYRPSGSRELLLLTLKIMLYLGGLSLVLYYGIKTFRKNTLDRASRGKSGRSVEVLESAFIGQNRNVSLVKILDQILVVGVTDHNISLLSTISDEPSVSRILSSHGPTAPGVAHNFSNTVNAFLSKFKREDRQSTFQSVYRGAVKDEE